MTIWKQYYHARSTTDALEALASAQGPARLIAGGTDLLLELQQGLHPSVDTLVDITSIPEMITLEIRQDKLFIGAGVPLNEIIRSPLVREHAQALREAASLIGGPQVRNVATLGGNVAHALPAADGTISLLALDAQAVIADRSGVRSVPLEALFLGPGKSALDPVRELLVGFIIPMRAESQASAFRRIMRPQGVAIAILNTAVWIQRNDEIIEDVRLAIGPAGPRPFRTRAAESALRGFPFGKEHIDKAFSALLTEVNFRTSPHRASSDYRYHIARSLLEETLTAAWQRSGKR